MKEMTEAISSLRPRTLTTLSVATQNNLTVYRRNYLYALLEALQRRYPSVVYFLGEGNFKFFAKKYIYATPSRNANLDNYGAEFPFFLQTRSELRSHFFLPDLAKIDDVYYRQDENFHFEVSAGTLSVWHSVQARNIPPVLKINHKQKKSVRCVIDEDVYLVER